MPEQPNREFKTGIATPRAQRVAEQMAAARADLARITEEDVEAAFPSLQAESLERIEAVDTERGHRKRTVEELEAYKRIQEEARRLREANTLEAEQAVATLRERILGAPADMRQTIPVSTRERVAFTPEALAAIRVEASKQAGLGRDVRELGGTMQGAPTVETGFASATTFRGAAGTEQPAEGPAMFSLAELEEQEKKKAASSARPTRPAA